MDVILHLGAHRTASTSFQDYMARSPWPGVAFWGPKITRGGLFDGVQGSPVGMRPMVRAKGRIAVQLARAEALGADSLVISDENLIGPLRSNLRCASVYPEIGMRMARLHAAFGGRITRIVLQIRALDSYWRSALAFGVSRSIACPDADLRARITTSTRSWRDVLAELACAVPGVPIIVTPFEQMAQRPDAVAAHITGQLAPPMPAQGIWTNRMMAAPRLRSCLLDAGFSPVDTVFDHDGRWQPFSAIQRQTLRAQTAADLAWLRAGADGLATYHEHRTPEPAIRAGLVPQTIRGSQDNDSQDRHMAHPR
jgi:hypothetical protein